MPNWSYNRISFYQEDNGNDMLHAFFADIQKYQDYKDPETGKHSSWVGHYLQSKRINADNLYSRGFFVSCELHDDHVEIEMETAWAPLPEIWELIAQQYELSFVYISEEPGCEVYVNTDDGRFFTTRYMINSFDVDYLELDAETLSEYGERLREIGSEPAYYDSLEKVLEDFKEFGFAATDLKALTNGWKCSIYGYMNTAPNKANIAKHKKNRD